MNHPGQAGARRKILPSTPARLSPASSVPARAASRRAIRPRRLALLLLALALLLPVLLPAGSEPAYAASPDGRVLYSTPNRSYNGASDYTDLTASLPAVASLAQGAISVRFKTSSAAQAKTLLSTSDVQDPSSNFSLTLNGGTVYAENRENGTYATQISASGSWNDNAWHTAVLNVDASGTKLYVDGSLRGSSASTAFFSSVTGLDGLWAGRNVDNGGGQWFYAGDIAELSVYSRPLSQLEIQEDGGQLPASAALFREGRAFNGTSDYTDRTAQLGQVSGLAHGSIAARFRTTSGAAAKTLLSASDSGDPSSNVTLSLNGGTVYYEARDNGAYSAQISASGSWNDGEWHTAVVTAGAGGTRLYVDGELRGSSANAAFFASVTELDGLWTGRNVDSGGGQWYFAGDIDAVAVYPSVLTASQLALVGATFSETILFDTSDGLGYGEYRIPSIVSTSNGTILAVAEGRQGGDQTPTDLVLRRSTDGGKTFGANVILSPGKSQGYAEMNPMLLAESGSGRVHLLWSRWKWGACQFFIRTSTDHGATWGAARDITSVLDAYKSASSPSYFANLAGAGMGPGHAIQLADGKLVVPIYLTVSGWSNSTVAAIYSSDGGTTWSAGPLVPNPSGYGRIHENMMIQLSDGRLMTNMRNPGSDYRAVSVSSGVTGAWSTPYSDLALPDPVCQGSLQRYDASTILFTNPANVSTRTSMTIRMSADDGSTWYRSKEIYPGTNGYSDIAVSPNKSIFVFYEKPAGQKIALAKFNKAWVESP
ncbi:hypothetical protein HGI30_19570 [Paenibacillus albicereus]|uniref:exo-alpha-sialidase n=1 Tax=Paenibacillus albicereus TaxID=2726185 RepID=A0A6H2H1H4_9BACL|nr:LamG-like jellyroll fold domain-containing protein [Paenibacillus albicereus]QJC53520.1 hypothetical protein HGI30_19570 [Paenibacillus albicereus]